MQVFLVLAVVGLAACNGASPKATPAPATGPAFKMTEVTPVSCPASLTATLCETAQITNIGGEIGDGSCRLRADETTLTGEDSAVFGEPTEVTSLAPGSQVSLTLTWPHAKPDVPFTVDCEPGPLA